MTRALDDEERFRDERAEQVRERDRQREPRRFAPRGRHDLRAQHAFQASVIDSAHRAIEALATGDEQMVCHWCDLPPLCATPTADGSYQPACAIHKSAGSIPLPSVPP